MMHVPKLLDGVSKTEPYYEVRLGNHTPLTFGGPIFGKT